jgi:two-component system, chemotaxis family, chemotaxis protein CheY
MPKRVLIVDDDPQVRKLVCGLLTFEGFSVCGQAGDGAQAIEKAKQMEPDMIVLDFAMPVMDGIHAAKTLQRIMPHVPLILFTAHASSALEEDALAAGIGAVVSKDDTSALVSKAHELLGQVEARLAWKEAL